jgi:hypothetical protein
MLQQRLPLLSHTCRLALFHEQFNSLKVIAFALHPLCSNTAKPTIRAANGSTPTVVLIGFG